MKIFEVQLKGVNGEVVYTSIVPEVHVKEKVDTLLTMNGVSNIGALNFKEIGDISDRYIQTFLQSKGAGKRES
jgi:hypothetical protein